jgi:hypothetical protein
MYLDLEARFSHSSGAINDASRRHGADANLDLLVEIEKFWQKGGVWFGRGAPSAQVASISSDAFVRHFGMLTPRQIKDQYSWIACKAGLKEGYHSCWRTIMAEGMVARLARAR